MRINAEGGIRNSKSHVLGLSGAYPVARAAAMRAGGRGGTFGTRSGKQAPTRGAGFPLAMLCGSRSLAANPTCSIKFYVFLAQFVFDSFVASRPLTGELRPCGYICLAESWRSRSAVG
jgi:hypothetical protein